MFRLVIVALVTASVGAQITLEGQCNLSQLNAVRDLNITGFAGEWYQIARIPNDLENGDCAIATFTPVIQNNVFVNAALVTRQVFNRTQVWLNATVTAGTGGAFVFSFSDVLSLDTLVIATDYSGYTLLYSCWQNTTHKNVWAWQLARRTTLSAAEKTELDTAISQNTDLNNTSWRTIGHSKDHCRTSAATNLASPFILSLALYTIVSKLL